MTHQPWPTEPWAHLVRRVVGEAKAADHPTSIADAIAEVPAEAIASFLHAHLDDATARELLTKGLGASPGAASGAVVFSAEAAIAAAEAGRAVVLVRTETTPDDVLGMQSARGILTTRGGITSHAAVVARGWGLPAVVGASEIVIDEHGLHLGERVFGAGTEIALDGRTGEVFLGGAGVSIAAAPPELEELLGWADQLRAVADHPVEVRANADNASDAAHARHLGAEGIGLCRTEHMFLAEDRLALVRRFILTDDPSEEQAALADLEAAQQDDFEAILAEMDGLPVTVRLLDPPLHEFLPGLELLAVAEALGRLDEQGRVELAAVRRLHEANPMIGTRGVRLGVVKPGVYQMQVRALARAVMAVRRNGRRPIVEVMVPLVIDPTEMTMARSWVAEALAAVDFDGELRVGAMLETPRAALLAGALAGVSDFFSFGTNDLTQLTFAFSRDDVGSRLIPAYLRSGLLTNDPFESLDQIGVGRLIRDATERARRASPTIKIGVCGEQAGDPESARFFVECGVDYVSCSPYRVPIARLAVAQALLGSGRVDAAVLASLRPARPEGAVASPDTVESATTSRAPAASGEAEFLVLHALRIKGFTGAETAADIAGISADTVDQVLRVLSETGLCRHLPGRDLWQLTPAGREHHGELLRSAVASSETAGLLDHYQRFLLLNVEFKDLCNRWQVRNGEPNEHVDGGYDAERLAELVRFHRDAMVPLGGFRSAVPRLETYSVRLAAALARLTGGETRMFTGVMCGSYHDVWMELHEDLVQLLGIDRHAEGSY